MPQNRGKQFEGVIKQAFERIRGVSVDRIPDQTNGYKNSSNVCDFMVYKYPYQYYIECKSVHGNTFPLSNVSKNQREGMLKKSKIMGVVAGVIIWWIDRDVTKFIPIQVIEHERVAGAKSLRYDSKAFSNIEMRGHKKRVFFDYDMDYFFHTVEKQLIGRG